MARQRALPVGPRLTSPFATVWAEADRERPSGRTLYLDGFPSSYVDLDDPAYLRYGYVRHLAMFLDALPPGGLDVVHLGGGAATLARYVAATRPGSRNLVVERDELVFRVARERMGLRTGPGLQVKIGEGRQALTRRPDASADAVVVDAFDGPRVPPSLLTPDFLADVHRVLRPGGLYLANLTDDPPLPVARALAAALLTVFRDAALVADTDTGDNLVFAAGRRVPLGPVRERLAPEGARQRLRDRGQLLGFAAARA